MNTGKLAVCVLGGALSCGAVSAQTYRELTLIRGRPSPYSSVLQVRAGVLAGFTDSENTAIGREDEVGWDGHVYYRQDNFGDRPAVLTTYAGRDGAYLGVAEGELLGQETQSRLEVFGRYYPFYREGFYQGDDYIPTGRYEGHDFGVQLALAREAGEGLRFEVGTFYRRMSFDRNADTDPNYVIPDNYNAFGFRGYLEQSSLVLDRVTGRPDQGFLLTMLLEREQNDSEARFGRVGVFESDLPSGVWRGGAHLEMYFPSSEVLTWEVLADGSVTDKKDRVYNFDAQKPIGHAWVDGSLGLRFEFGDAFWMTPMAKGQFVRTLQQNGVDTDQEVFLGAGIDLGIDFSDDLGVVAEYSYLENPSREPVSVSRDTFGEHRLFVGFEARFGAQRQ